MTVQSSSSETAYALAFGDICDELKCDHDLNAVLHAIRSRGAAQPPMDLERRALEQIRTVCIDNAGPTCKHKMALGFCRQIAEDYLALLSTPSTPK